MLSNASKYAIRAVLFLSKNSNSKKKYSAVDIAHDLNIPLHFIAKLLQQLAKSKIISSSKGPNGGFYLTDKNNEHSLYALVNIIENKDIFEGCYLGLPQCNDEHPCPVHHIASKFKDEMLELFQQKTIAEVAKDVDDNGTYITLKGII